jgi:preprotein translocase subunit SecG
MNSNSDQDEELAGARTLNNELRPTTFALAALIFVFAGLSALWLLAIAGLAAVCSLIVAVLMRVPASNGVRPL